MAKVTLQMLPELSCIIPVAPKHNHKCAYWRRAEGCDHPEGNVTPNQDAALLSLNMTVSQTENAAPETGKRKQFSPGTSRGSAALGDILISVP